MCNPKINSHQSCFCWRRWRERESASKLEKNWTIGCGGGTEFFDATKSIFRGSGERVEGRGENRSGGDEIDLLRQ